MKKFILAALFLGAVFSGRSQVILNEMISDNANGANQFVELYNVGNDDVDLSCYRIASFQISNGNPQRVTKINIIDFPDGAVIPAKGYYTLGEAASIQSKPMNYNWSAATQPTGASFKTYSVTNGATPSISGPANGSGDFVLEATGNTKMAIFLFDGSSKDASNNIFYINGFVGFGNLTQPTPNPALPGVPASFNLANFPTLDVTGTTCGTAKIDWKKLTTSEYSEAATGSNHGYERLANGLCGTWQKITSGYSPNTRNRLGNTSTSTSGTITATETALCNSVAWSITAYPDAQYPLTLQLYYDDGDGVLEDGEEKDIIATVNSLPASGQFTLTSPLPNGSVPVIAYKTPFGCFARVFKASNIVTFTTSQYSICNQQIGASITAADVLATTYGFPVTVNFFNNGSKIGTASIPNPSSTIYYSNFSATQFADPTKLSVQFIPSNCLKDSSISSATTTFTPAAGTLVTNEQFVANGNNPNNVPGKFQVRVSGVTSSTGFNSEDASSLTANVLPLIASVYWDHDPTISSDDELIESIAIPAFSQGYQEFDHNFTPSDLDAHGKLIVVTYTAKATCLTKRAEGIALGSLPVTYQSFNATRKDDSKVSLKWTTASEQNNKGFYVQRSVAGSAWKDVAFVFSEADGGNSTQELSYSFTDLNGAKDISQYRILQVDLDGKGHYSEVRSVRGTGAVGAGLLLFPNPSTNGTVNLLFGSEGARTIVVSDVSGRVVQQHRGITGSSYTLSNLITGYYSVQVVEQDGRATTQKVLVTKR